MEELIETLKSCGYDAFFVKTKEEALELSKTYIKSGMTVGLGGSVSVNEIGLLDYILNKKEDFESGLIKIYSVFKKWGGINVFWQSYKPRFINH